VAGDASGDKDEPVKKTAEASDISSSLASSDDGAAANCAGSRESDALEAETSSDVSSQSDRVPTSGGTSKNKGKTDSDLSEKSQLAEISSSGGNGSGCGVATAESLYSPTDSESPESGVTSETSDASGVAAPRSETISVMETDQEPNPIETEDRPVLSDVDVADVVVNSIVDTNDESCDDDDEAMIDVSIQILESLRRNSTAPETTFENGVNAGSTSTNVVQSSSEEVQANHVVPEVAIYSNGDLANDCCVSEDHSVAERGNDVDVTSERDRNEPTQLQKLTTKLKEIVAKLRRSQSEKILNELEKYLLMLDVCLDEE
jgi:hypothetical protein